MSTQQTILFMRIASKKKEIYIRLQDKSYIKIVKQLNNKIQKKRTELTHI